MIDVEKFTAVQIDDAEWDMAGRMLGFNDCHDQFTALIAKDYVNREKLPSVENIKKFIDCFLGCDCYVNECGDTVPCAQCVRYSLEDRNKVSSAIRERIER
jgi:hypothetical protein